MKMMSSLRSGFFYRCESPMLPLITLSASMEKNALDIFDFETFKSLSDLLCVIEEIQNEVSYILDNFNEERTFKTSRKLIECIHLVFVLIRSKPDVIDQYNRRLATKQGKLENGSLADFLRGNASLSREIMFDQKNRTAVKVMIASQAIEDVICVY